MTIDRDPISRDLKAAHPLTGLSGFSVLLATKDGRRWFVRKAAPNASLAPRLKRQAQKQRAFLDRARTTISVPRVLDEGEIEGRYYFDMEYVRGRDGISYIQRASYADITKLCDRLGDYLRSASSAPPLLSSPHPTLFRSLYHKLCEIQRRTNSAIPEPVCAKVFVALERLLELDDLPPSLCHGDLTLENTIIRDDGQIYVLDLLEAPFEHYFQDLAKLHQDLAGGWYTRHRQPIAQCVLDYMRRRLKDAGNQLNPAYGVIHPVLMAVVFARILPYASSDEERAFVLRRMEHFAEEAATP